MSGLRSVGGDGRLGAQRAGQVLNLARFVPLVTRGVHVSSDAISRALDLQLRDRGGWGVAQPRRAAKGGHLWWRYAAFTWTRVEVPDAAHPTV